MAKATKEFKALSIHELAKRGPRKWYTIMRNVLLALVLALTAFVLVKIYFFNGIVNMLPWLTIGYIAVGILTGVFYDLNDKHNVKGYYIWWYYTEEGGYSSWRCTTKHYPMQAKSWVIQLWIKAKPEWKICWGDHETLPHKIEIPESVWDLNIRVKRSLCFVPMLGGTVLQVWSLGAGSPPPISLEFNLLKQEGFGISGSRLLRDILEANNVFACLDRAYELARTLATTQETQAALAIRVAGVLRDLEAYNSSRPTGMVIPRQTALELASALDAALPANDPLRQEFQFPEIVARMEAWLERYATNSSPH